MYERFTDRARKVFQLANREAQRLNHEYIGTEHILLGLVAEGSGVAGNVLRSLDVDSRTVRHEVEKIIHPNPEMVTFGTLPQTPRAKNVIEYAREESRGLAHNYVGTEHILLGLLREEGGVAYLALKNAGCMLDAARKAVRDILGVATEVESVKEAGNTPQPSCISQGKIGAIELRKAIEYGFDMQHPQSCPVPCHWSSDRHGAICPYGGCVGMKIEPPIDPPIDPDFETQTITNGRIKTIKHAARAAAADELRTLLMEDAKRWFELGDEDQANVMRKASLMCSGWGQNERELQARSEKLHGRVEQV